MEKTLKLQFGKFKLSIVRECRFKLDGGAMFGVVPKTLWEKSSPSDAENRIELVCNLLVIETPSGLVLVECGMGRRWSAVESERYGLESFVDPGSVLASASFANEDVEHVIISHLHFDHAGGACRELNGRLVPTFPNAKYYVQKGELELAQNPNARAKGSYRAQDYMPLLEHGSLVVIDGDHEVVPGVFARVTGGHTKAHQVVTFASEGKKGVYFADIIPTKSHLSPPWVMGYDHFPLTSCDVKSTWLARAAEENWLVVFDHEVGIPWGHVTKQEKFNFEPLNISALA